MSFIESFKKFKFSPKSGHSEESEKEEERLSFSNQDYVKTFEDGEVMFQRENSQQGLEKEKAAQTNVIFIFL